MKSPISIFQKWITYREEARFWWFVGAVGPLIAFGSLNLPIPTADTETGVALSIIVPVVASLLGFLWVFASGLALLKEEEP